jgi:hypothetical protein
MSEADGKFEVEVVRKCGVKIAVCRMSYIQDNYGVKPSCMRACSFCDFTSLSHIRGEC